MATDDELRQIARKRAEEKAGFYTHFAIYILVNLFLIAVWWFTGGQGPSPGLSSSSSAGGSVSWATTSASSGGIPMSTGRPRRSTSA